MATEGTIEIDGRPVGFADYGPIDATPVLWGHGGPGSRLEPAALADAAAAAGLRVVGIDRPGYGKSAPRPGRTIEDWVPDALAVADHLGIGAFAVVGVSTGGSYAMAVAALAADRVLGAVACCSVTDMRWPQAMQLVPDPHLRAIWAVTDRDAALALAAEVFGADGSGMLNPDPDRPALAPADMAMLADPAQLPHFLAGLPEMFAFGVQGYADDRIADGAGWGGFDVGAITCPVTVVHGAEDTIVPVAFAHHTASLVPGATVRVVDGLGHLSVVGEVVRALADLLR